MGLPRLFVVTLAVITSRGRGTAEPPPTPSGAQCLDSACYGLFWAPRSFPRAAEACEAGGGHLMTVRSTVAAEAIVLLMGGRAGSAWLGLRLPEASCVQPAKRLRGFQWVTGDERTDYAAWANNNGTDATAEAPACGPRCVAAAATQPRGLSWREGACEAEAEGFLCEYTYPGGACAPLAPPPAAAVAYLLPFGAREADLGALPPGTVAELLGLSLECRARDDGSLGWGRAAPGAWDCRLENGGCQGRCVPDGGGGGRPACTCPEGQALREEDGRGCRPACVGPGCPRPCLPQEDGAAPGGGACVCMEGYAPDPRGGGCLDVDDCAAEPGPCDPEEQVCVNTEGGFECRCAPGFFQEAEGGQCVEDWQQRCFDLDCQHDCERGAGGGGARCTCFEGFAADPRNPRACRPFCNQTECPPQCDPHTGASCVCPDGFVLDSKDDGTEVCADIDECASEYCGDLPCVNTPGSYSCVCLDGGLCLGQEEGSSGDEATVLPPVPPKDGLSRGMLVGIALGVTFAVALLLAVLCYMVKKRHFAQSGKDYRCQQTETGVVLQHVSPNSSSSGQKL